MSDVEINKIKRILYRGDIVLYSGLHIGSPDMDDPLGAVPCRIDSKGIPYIPGASLAGRFLDTLNQFNIEEKLKKYFTLKDLKLEDYSASRLNFRSAYPVVNNNLVSSEQDLDKIIPPFPRDRNAVDPELGVAKEDFKFAIMEVPADIRFRFLIELDLEDWGESNEGKLDNEEKELIKNYTEYVLDQWTRFGYLGGSSRTGCGWFYIENLEKFELSSDDFNKFIEIKDPRIDGGFTSFIPAGNPNYGDTSAAFRITVRIGKREDGYGWDSLLIGGGDLWSMDEGLDNSMIHRWRSIEINPNTTDPYKRWKNEAFIPGSTLKGNIKRIVDRLPVISNEVKEKLFGSPARKSEGRAGSILFGHLLPEGEVEEIPIERHAEDEFAGSVFGTGKFDEKAVFEGNFSGWIVLDSSNEKENFFEEFRQLLINLSSNNLISLGAKGSYLNIKVGELIKWKDFSLKPKENK